MNVRDVLPQDAIPSIDDPTFDGDYIGEPDDQVVILEGELPRAYPVRILSYHEIVNDVVDGRPVAVTWCPLCGSAVIYDRTVDGRTLEFGVSGKLADDDLVMYDRETGSEWKQSLGECIAGDLEGVELEVLPAAVTTYEQFRETNPEGVVLQPADARSEAASDDDEPAPIDYDMRPYEEYFESDGIGLPAHRGEGEGRPWDRGDLAAKAVILGVEHDGEAIGYPRSRVEAESGVVTDRVGDLDVVVFATDDGIYAYENTGYKFDAGSDGFHADGTEWDPSTGESDDGRQLRRLPTRRLFAFASQDDHGPDAFFEH